MNVIFLIVFSNFEHFSKTQSLIEDYFIIPNHSLWEKNLSSETVWDLKYYTKTSKIFVKPEYVEIPYLYATAEQGLTKWSQRYRLSLDGISIGCLSYFEWSKQKPTLEYHLIHHRSHKSVIICFHDQPRKSNSLIWSYGVFKWLWIFR